MSEKRRDSKNRILHEGEVQLSDGRYRYKYQDIDGAVRYAYSWRLVQNDRGPDGKKTDIPLREKERQIHMNMFNNVSNKDANMTVLELVKKYVSTKIGVRESTKTGYKTVLNFLEKEPFGKRKVGTVRVSDAKCWLIKLQQEDGKSYSTIHSIRGVLRPAFKMAFEDDLIRKNPFDFELATVVINDSITREAISRDQERRFLKFIQEDPHFSRYYDAIYVLFKTGLRISEFAGLTIPDIDFKEHCIHVERQLLRTSNMRYIIEKTKTESGKRTLPMSWDVEACFRRIIDARKYPRVEPMIDGHCGFLFLDKNNLPMVALHWEKYFKHIVEKYNSTYKQELPKITPHVCRHTYCTNMAKSGMNPKTLQYLMGHSDITITLNTYTHTSYEDAKHEVFRLSSAANM